MRRFFLRILLICAPFAVVFGTVVVVDPYNYFNWCHVVSDEVKLKNLNHDGKTMAFSNLMWKMKEYRRKPVPDLLIGDSRLSYFDLQYLDKATGQSWYNFGVPGGNHRTALDVFDYVDSIAPPNRVYMQVSFRNMAAGQDYDIFSEPLAVEGTPGLYVSNRRVLAATWLAIKACASPGSVQYDVLSPDHWNNVMTMERDAAASFKMDTAFYHRMEEVAVECRKQGTELVLVEWPSHESLHTVRTEAGLDAQRAAYADRLRSMATYVDLDAPGNTISADRSNFRDPLHLTTEAQRMVVDALLKR
ncbi:MAG: hypothetical protein IPJ76_09485 [Flavobacteriales bacterium]|nr:MAG: hypothetical protein IPJ76_09485 [Flavobacteriales bacterium]